MKNHVHTEGEILAAADKELIGKTLNEGKIVFTIGKGFYHGEEANEEEFTEALQNARNVNLVGHECYRIAKKHGLIGENVIRIQGVPHAQIYKI